MYTSIAFRLIICSYASDKSQLGMVAAGVFLNSRSLMETVRTNIGGFCGYLCGIVRSVVNFEVILLGFI